MLRKKSIFFIVLAASLLSPLEARAGFLGGFIGNTNVSNLAPPGNNGVPDGTINFAVLDRTGGTILDPWGIGLTSSPAATTAFYAGFNPGKDGVYSGPLDTTARYLYLYQVANNGPNTGAFDSISISFESNPSTYVTSWGAWSTSTSSPLVFADNNGNVNSVNTGASNNFGIDTGSFIPSALAPAHIGVTTPSIAIPNTSTVVLPEGPIPNSGTRLTSTSLRYNGATEFPTNTMSTLFGFTSNTAPTYNFGSLQDSGLPSGQVPVPDSLAPEPATISLMGLGMAIAGLTWYRKKKQVALAL